MNTSGRTTRRRFLRQSASALGATFGVPLLLPASVLGRDGATPPSERVTMGFIGVGGQGRGHLLGGAWTYITGGYVARDDVQVLAVCDVFRSRRDEACARVNEHYTAQRGAGAATCRAYRDFREVLARDDIDAVLVATPVHWHGVMSILAAQAGKDVYCEKPSAITIREGQAVADAVRRYGRVYQAGTQQRSEYGGRFRIACERIRSGRIGKVKEVYAHCRGGTFSWEAGRGQPQAVPDDLDWDLWLGPAPRMPFDGNAGGHRFATGGVNWGQHHYDIVQWILDADRTGPVEVGVEHGITYYKYASGATVYACGYPGEGSSLQARPWASMEGEHIVAPGQGLGMIGGARFVGTDGWLAVDRENLVAHPKSVLDDPLPPEAVHVYRTDSHSGNFLECVRTRKQPICDVETAHRAASALLLGGIAERIQRPLKWDPEHERFEDEEANRLLSTAFRSPWHL